MNNFQSQPLKLYIQDIYRAKRTSENKYIYGLFGLTFKNITVNGVITAIFNTTDKSINFEICDPTGTIQVYHDVNKSNATVQDGMIKNLNQHFTSASKFGDENIGIMATLMDKIKKKRLAFSEGDFVRLVGDIFVDERGYRKISAFECIKTSEERDIIWLEELRYLYEKFYLKSREDETNI